MKTIALTDIKHRYYLIMLSLILATVYLITAPHFATLEDSAIFIMASYWCGIAHPPGYPLFVVLGKLFTLIPVGTIAFRVHMLNMLLGTASCCFTYGIIVRLKGDRVAALFGALSLGLTGIFWFQSIIAEVYVLQALLFSILFFIALDLRDAFSPRSLALFSFILGLAMTNHYPLMILAAGTFICLLWDRKGEIVRHWYIVLGFFSLGLLPYLHLYLARFYSGFSYYYPIENADDFFRYILRSDYSFSNISTAWTIADSVKFVGSFIKDMVFNFAFIGFAFIFVGCVAAWRNLPRRIFLALALGVASSSIFLLFLWRLEFTLLSRELYRYWQVVPLVCCYSLIGIGLSHIGHYRRIPPGARVAALLVCGLACVFACFAFNVRSNDLRHDSFGYDYSKIILRSMPSNAVLILFYDADIGPVCYVNLVEKFRSDVTVTTQVGVGTPERIYDRRISLTVDESRAIMVNYISRKLAEGRRVFSTEPLQYFGGIHPLPFVIVDHGLYYEYCDKGKLSGTIQINEELVHESLTFLDSVERGAYRDNWAFMRDEILRKLVRLLHVAGRTHPLAERHWWEKYLKARDFMDARKDYKSADSLFLQLLPEISLRDAAEQTPIYFQFLKNRVNLAETASIDAGERTHLIQEALNISMKIALKDSRCGNILALMIVEQSRRIPVTINEALFQQTFYKCPEFQRSF